MKARILFALSFFVFATACGESTDTTFDEPYAPGSPCGQDGFFCDRACVPGWFACNGERDCNDFDDEAGCDSSSTPPADEPQCLPPNKECADGCIPSGTTCCGRSPNGSQLVYCPGDLACHQVSASVDPLGYQCGCPTGEQMCNGRCIDEDYSCCPGGTNGWHCKEGECRQDPAADDGFSCYCPSGQKWCDGSCIPSSADCCGEGSGGLYCTSGTCFADPTAQYGYSCGQPTGVCLYQEYDYSACSGSSPREWKCDSYATTLDECRADHRDDSFCSGSCCWHTYRSQHQIYQGTCSEALASKN